MSKCITISCLFIFIAHTVFAQFSAENPFKQLNFITNATDTVTLVASYNGIIDSLTNSNQSIISTIKKHGGKPVKNATYTINIQLPGYPKKLAIACADQSMLNTLKSIIRKIYSSRREGKCRGRVGLFWLWRSRRSRLEKLLVKIRFINWNWLSLILPTFLPHNFTRILKIC